MFRGMLGNLAHFAIFQAIIKQTGNDGISLQWAALIHSNCALSSISTSSFHHKRRARGGILFLQYLGFREKEWPVFSLACEADETSQFLQILLLSSEAERQLFRDSNHLPSTQRMTKGIEKYNDLDIDCNVNYTKIPDVVISYDTMFATLCSSGNCSNKI